MMQHAFGTFQKKVVDDFDAVYRTLERRCASATNQAVSKVSHVSAHSFLCVFRLFCVCVCVFIFRVLVLSVSVFRVLPIDWSAVFVFRFFPSLIALLRIVLHRNTGAGESKARAPPVSAARVSGCEEQSQRSLRAESSAGGEDTV